MYCPSSIILNSKIVFITLHTSADYYRASQIPWGERLNPLRYELIFAPFTKHRTVINKDGKLATKFSNLIWGLKCAYVKETFYKLSIGSYWIVDSKSIIDIERELQIANGTDPADIKIETVRMTRKEFDALPEFDGF